MFFSDTYIYPLSKIYFTTILEHFRYIQKRIEIAKEIDIINKRVEEEVNLDK